MQELHDNMHAGRSFPPVHDIPVRKVREKQEEGGGRRSGFCFIVFYLFEDVGQGQKRGNPFLGGEETGKERGPN